MRLPHLGGPMNRRIYRERGQRMRDEQRGRSGDRFSRGTLPQVDGSDAQAFQLPGREFPGQ